MALSSYSEYTCVVWKVKPGQSRSIFTSNSFSLCDSERKLKLYQLQLHYDGYYDCYSYQDGYFAEHKLKLTPQFSSTSSVQVLVLWTETENGSILLSSNVNISKGCEISKFPSSLGSLCNKRIKITCIFHVLPVGQKSSEFEMVCFTSRHTSPQIQSPQTPDSNLENLSSDFGQFLKDTTFTDVTLKCRDSTISAHRSVLAARSPVFAAMFRNKMAECKNGVVQIDDLDPDIFESFLKFLYSGKIANLSEKNVSILFSTSDKYNVRRLQQQCSQWIIEHLTLQNCIGFLQLADTHNYEDLKNSVVEFIVGNTSVFQREEWAQFKDVNSKLANFVYEKCLCKVSNIRIA